MNGIQVKFEGVVSEVNFSEDLLTHKLQATVEVTVADEDEPQYVRMVIRPENPVLPYTRDLHQGQAILVQGDCGEPTKDRIIVYPTLILQS